MSASALLRSAPATTSAPARFGASTRLGVGSARGLEVPTSSCRRRGRASALAVFAGKASRAGKKSGGGGGSGKSSGGGSDAPNRQAAPGNPAPRITGKVGRMTVHTQIKLVERYKSLTTGGSGGGSGPGGGKGGAAAKPATVEKTGFRRVKDDAYQEELARRRAAKQAEARHLQNLKAHSGRGKPPVLIVDGYNICGCDEGAAAGLPLKDAFLSGDLETAQRRLVDELDNLAVHKGYRVLVVFDADRAVGAGGLDQASRTDAGVWVVFSVTNDADSWIERASLEELRGESSVDEVLRRARDADSGRATAAEKAASRRRREEEETDDVSSSEDAPRAAEPGGGQRVVYVATSDNALSSVVRCNGAYVVSAGSLIEEMTRARADEKEILRELAVKAKWGGEKRGLAMVTKDAETADKLMSMYLAAPNASTAKYGSLTGGFSSKPKKGKKNKKKD